MSRIETTPSTELSSFPTPSAGAATSNPNWYSALSRAMGRQLDGQAAQVKQLATELPHQATIGQVMQVQAEATLMQVMSSSAASVNNSIGQGLEALARR
jgi:hypothetical protein